MDVVGCKKPLVVCIDCKHWQHSIATSALKRIVDLQVNRTRALADSLPNPALKLNAHVGAKPSLCLRSCRLYPVHSNFTMKSR